MVVTRLRQGLAYASGAGATMATYTIQIFNNSGFNKSYVTFMAPSPGPNDGGQSLSNVWATFPSVTPGGFDTVTYEEQVFAYWGRTPCEQSTGPSSGFAQINPSTGDTVPFSAGDGFAPVQSPGQTQPGSFSIVSDDSFTGADGYVFGFAKPAGAPTPTPVMSVVAEPNMTFIFTPDTRFSVAEGAYTPGEVIDPTITRPGAEIDFTDRAETTAIATQNPDESWTVTYA